MPLFQIETSNRVSSVKLKKFNSEKELQGLVENNLEAIFGCRFIATEFSTGVQHGGRIDTLALSEENNPVIIEYKTVASSELINQSLFYLSWMNDHRGDFQVAVNKKLGNNQKVDWEKIRVICLAPEYKKYDLHAARMIGANIELWQFKLYSNGVLHLEDVFRKPANLSEAVFAEEVSPKNPVMVSAGKKAAMTRATEVYTFEEHIQDLDEKMKDLVELVREFLIDLDDTVEEVPKKLYVAYKVSKNFCCMETHKNKIGLFLKLDPMEIKNKPENMRDVSNIGHFGTGDLEIIIRNETDLDAAKKYIEAAFENVGG
jgi:predicted transport protein